MYYCDKNVWYQSYERCFNFRFNIYGFQQLYAKNFRNLYNMMYCLLILEFMGPAEVSLMIDSCDGTMHTFYRAFAKDVLRYINVEDNKVKLNVASFCSKVEPISSYQDMYYIHPSLKYENIMANKQWTASQIIGDYILHFNDIRSSNKIGIVLVNDATNEPNLRLIAQFAYQQGITLFAIGIDYGQQNLEMKLAQISPNGYMKLPLNQLNVMGMNFLITNFMAMGMLIFKC